MFVPYTSPSYSRGLQQRTSLQLFVYLEDNGGVGNESWQVDQGIDESYHHCMQMSSISTATMWQSAIGIQQSRGMLIVFSA
jgi:hypothetical protein